MMLSSWRSWRLCESFPSATISSIPRGPPNFKYIWLGFQRVAVIDEDLGRSASGLVDRSGFQQLVGAVCAGTVGAVFCLEASRLARNGREWHYLIDLCGMAGTVIVDPDGIYDPSLMNDRLLLGLNRPDTQGTSCSTFPSAGPVWTRPRSRFVPSSR